jgi:hypothetical protein
MCARPCRVRTALFWGVLAALALWVSVASAAGKPTESALLSSPRAANPSGLLQAAMGSSAPTLNLGFAATIRSERLVDSIKGVQVYAIAKDGAVCFFGWSDAYSGAIASTCGSLASIRSSLLVSGPVLSDYCQSNRGNRVVIGLVSDQAKAVVVHIGSQSVTVTPTHDFFAVRYKTSTCQGTAQPFISASVDTR